MVESQELPDRNLILSYWNLEFTTSFKIGIILEQSRMRGGFFILNRMGHMLACIDLCKFCMCDNELWKFLLQSNGNDLVQLISFYCVLLNILTIHKFFRYVFWLFYL